MNYKERIEALQQKGIFSEAQAEKLASSFEAPVEKEQTEERKRWTLDIVGAVLLAAVLFYTLGALLTDTPSTAVENVSDTLNSVSTSGIGSGSTALLIVLFTGSLFYLFLYLLAHQRYHKAIRMIEEKKVLMQTLHHSEVMKKELGEKMEILLKQEGRRADIEIASDEMQSDKVFVMSVFREREEEIQSKKESLSKLETACQAYLKTFPNSLALLVAKLPECHSLKS